MRQLLIAIHFIEKGKVKKVISRRSKGGTPNHGEKSLLSPICNIAIRKAGLNNSMFLRTSVEPREVT